MLAPVQLTLLAERRRFRPYGLKGGDEGAAGAAWVVKDGEEVRLPGKCSTRLDAGDAVRLETPGGGGWGVVPTSRMPDEV
jgi:N-methylhydantoinase B